MIVTQMLNAKGREVVTIAPEATLADAAKLLGTRRIGAAVVSRTGEDLAGIVSERDIVRLIGEIGPDALGRPISDCMTARVITCSPSDTVERLLTVMTARRIRHLPVMEEGRLAGIISIGDVVKARIETVEAEAEMLREYVMSA